MDMTCLAIYKIKRHFLLTQSYGIFPSIIDFAVYSSSDVINITPPIAPIRFSNDPLTVFISPLNRTISCVNTVFIHSA